MNEKKLIIALLNAIEYIEELVGHEYDQDFIMTQILGVDEQLLKQLKEEK